MQGLSDSELAMCFKLPPERVIAYLKNKGYTISWDWEEVWQEAHAEAFTVAKVTRLDILEDIRRALEQALAEGKTGKWFARELTPVLQAKGWWGETEVTDPVTGELTTVQQGSPWRLDTIYRTNMTALYSAGRWAEQMENIDDRPFGMYVAIRDSHTRQSHLALHGKVFRMDDPFWKAFYPPNGWRCRCSVITLTAAEVRERGLRPEASGNNLTWSLQMISEKTGEMQPQAQYRFRDIVRNSEIRISPDKGWSYNPGEGYRPDLARYQGNLKPLAQRELGGH
ncbi:phage minor head protein [Citrobacter portucalensis]|uniref:phage head morphogenesis protein n=1 Tax=Citrobacter portucalensis TaxID=1639133 RepID=UPI00226B3A66|nr:phage minor head protein [Citrobacter portucalensis]MCX9038491.1 phage minor head protein [Citrobacter portucalensis]